MPFLPPTIKYFKYLKYLKNFFRYFTYISYTLTFEMFYIFRYLKYFKCFSYFKIRSRASQGCTRAANALLTPNHEIFFPSATPTTSSLLCNPAWMVIFAGTIISKVFLSQTLKILSESAMNMRNKTELECPFRILFRRTPHWENCKTHSHFPTRSQLGLRVTWSWI